MFPLGLRKYCPGHPNQTVSQEMVAAIPEVQKYYKKQNNAAGQRKVYGRAIEASHSRILLNLINK